MKKHIKLIVVVFAFIIMATFTGCMPVTGTPAQQASAREYNHSVTKITGSFFQGLGQGIGEVATDAVLGNNRYYNVSSHYVSGYVPYYYGGVRYYRHPGWARYGVPGHYRH
jgi:hypothetical protein